MQNNYYKEQDRRLNLFGAIASRLVSLGHLFLGNKWYDQNKYFRYKKGTNIKLKSPRYAGYGIVPRGEIVGYIRDELFHSDKYIIKMTSYDYEGTPENERLTWDDWMNGKRFPENYKTKTKEEIHSKWNIEAHFEKKQKQHKQRRGRCIK